MLQEGPRPLRKPGTRRYYRGRFQKSNLLRRPANQSRRKTQMDEPLHPSSLSEILDRTAHIYRSRFLVFLGIAVIPTAALLVLAGGAILVVVQWGSKGGGSISPAAVGILLIAFTVGLVLVVLPILLGV